MNGNTIGARLARLWWIVARPRKAATAIQAAPGWVLPFLLLVAGQLLIVSFQLDDSIRATLDRIPPSATAADRVEIVQTLHEEHVARSLFLPIRLGAGWAVFALWVFGLARSFFPRGDLRFPQMFSLVIHVEVFGLMSKLSILLRCRWFPSDDAVNNLAPPLGFAGVFPYMSDHTLWLYLRSVDIFALGALCALSVGVAELGRVSVLRASAVVVFAWVSATLGNVLLVTLISHALHLNLN
jgi:hypothetical protein